MSKRTKILGDLEQLEALYSDVAKLTGSYYQDLKAQHLPDELVSDLVRDFHMEWWQTIMNPPKPDEGLTY